MLERPTEGQIDDLLSEIKDRTSRGEKVFVTTLTKKMSEDLTDYLDQNGVKVRYLHSEIKTLERTKIIRDLRTGVFDVLVGINLLREGLDVPEVTLVAILDADKEGFLRSETSLIQTIGRAARNANGKVIMYADTITHSMDVAIKETQRRREIQDAYNEANGITPKTIVKEVRDLISISPDAPLDENKTFKQIIKEANVSKAEIEKLINEYTEEMKVCAKYMEFEEAAEYRDKINALKEKMKEV